MPLSDTSNVRSLVIAYLEREIGFKEFQKRFARFLVSLKPTDATGLRATVLGVELALSEFSNGDIDSGQFRNELAAVLNSPHSFNGSRVTSSTSTVMSLETAIQTLTLKN